MPNTLPTAVASMQTVEVTETREEKVITLTLTLGDAARVHNALREPYGEYIRALKIDRSSGLTLGESLDEVRRVLDSGLRAAGTSPARDLQR